MSIFSADIFTRLNWLTRKVNILLAYMARTIQQKAVEEEANPPYLEIMWDGGPAFSSVFDYNNLFGDGSHNPNFIPFTSLVINGFTHRLYGGGNMQINSGDLDVTKLVGINDPHGVITYLNASALSGCIRLTYINLAGITRINQYDVFFTSTPLNYVNLPNLTTIGNGAYRTFYGCSELLYVNMPKLEEIGPSADQTFEGCVLLKTISLPSLHSIYASYTFAGCTGFIDINLPSLTTFSITDCNTDLYTFASITGSTATLTISQTAASGCSLTVSGAALDIQNFLIANPGVTVVQV